MADWLSRLETLSPKEINLGLERVEQVLDRLALTVPDDLLLIAGTNGKGSSVAMADALLRASGRTVGAYTSPHINRFNERIVVNGEAASDATIVSAFEAVNAARGDIVLTYFEFGTLAAAVIFAEARLDVWILEIGLGGRLDACNAFNPSASLITNVTLDHCEWLGHDVETIATEKAGVMRRNRPTIYGSESMPQSVESAARQRGAILRRAGRDYQGESTDDGRWSYVSEHRTLVSLLPPGLRGDFQTGNAAAVLMLLESAGLAAGIDAERVNKVLPELKLAGRMQNHMAFGRRWLLDVAHNPAAARMLATTLAADRFAGQTVAIVGLLNDKDVEGVIAPLLPRVDRWVAMQPWSPRAIPANELARQVANLAVRACLVATSTEEAVEFARRITSENDRILVTGSFFTVAPVSDCLAFDGRNET